MLIAAYQTMEACRARLSRPTAILPLRTKTRTKVALPSQRILLPTEAGSIPMAEGSMLRSGLQTAFPSGFFLEVQSPLMSLRERQTLQAGAYL